MTALNGALGYMEAVAQASNQADVKRRPYVVFPDGRGFGIEPLDIFAAVYNGPGQTHKELSYCVWPTGWRYER